jgi:hypothetical protein
MKRWSQEGESENRKAQEHTRVARPITERQGSRYSGTDFWLNGIHAQNNSRP